MQCTSLLSLLRTLLMVVLTFTAHQAFANDTSSIHVAIFKRDKPVADRVLIVQDGEVASARSGSDYTFITDDTDLDNPLRAVFIGTSIQLQVVGTTDKAASVRVLVNISDLAEVKTVEGLKVQLPVVDNASTEQMMALRWGTPATFHLGARSLSDSDLKDAYRVELTATKGAQ